MKDITIKMSDSGTYEECRAFITGNNFGDQIITYMFESIEGFVCSIGHDLYHEGNFVSDEHIKQSGECLLAKFKDSGDKDKFIADCREQEVNRSILDELKELVAETEAAIKDIDACRLPATMRAEFEQLLRDAQSALAQLRKNEAASVICSACGQHAQNVIGCPDGSEICQACFDSGAH